MAVINEFDEIVREHMNLMDRTTRKTIISLDEADQNQLLAALTSKLYDKIVEKVDDIDFGTIPRSRGDITKIENYTSLMECIDILRNIIVEYKENTLPIDTVSSAVENLKQRKALFMKAYTLNVEMPIILYNTIALSIVSSVSFLISGSIEYIKDPGAETFTIALDKVGYSKTSQNLLFENLSMFNNACSKGDIDLAMNDVIRNNKRLSESGEINDDDGFEKSTIIINIGGDRKGSAGYGDIPKAGGCEPEVDTSLPADAFMSDDIPINDTCKTVKEDNGILAPVFWAGKALIAIARLIVPMLQNLVYFFYHSKQSISDYFAIQSELIQMNAYKVQYSTTMSEDQRRSVYGKQMKIANNLRKISNLFSIDYKKSVTSADSLAKEEKKKFTTDELGIAPDISTNSSQSSLF